MEPCNKELEKIGIEAFMHPGLVVCWQHARTDLRKGCLVTVIPAVIA